ncbi:MAG: hypothetical protein LBC72_03345 [Spirochaetaceae bacterium]|nr:hypothetical protein [Spirochaetaceae bacterium]
MSLNADTRSVDVLSGIAVVAFIGALILVFLYYAFFRRQPASSDGAAPLPPASYVYTPQDGTRGEARTCPVCAARFELGENVRSVVFPATGRHDRLLHMLGCKFCLKGGRVRKCPVCDAELTVDEYLIARIFERPGKSHVHVQGCVHCLNPKGKGGQSA